MAKVALVALGCVWPCYSALPQDCIVRPGNLYGETKRATLNASALPPASIFPTSQSQGRKTVRGWYMAATA